MNIIKKIFGIIIKNKAFNSKVYWDDRYTQGRNSGAGSYGRLSLFKAEVINNFIAKNNIDSVIEFGCGDGNQLSLFKTKYYTGFDVSEYIIKELKIRYQDDQNKSFLLLSEYDNQQADLIISLDVIYHLIEDNVYDNYMNMLFEASKEYVIIYASNYEHRLSQHVRHRKFTDWIDKHKKSWRLNQMIPNKYPYKIWNSRNTSFSDFYIFEKIGS